ncbi:hypothetical protein PHYPO_G00015640 [Pangasianodon hypophthalmus]|uniref:Uncharacterized protein n=1 Tax=Pangasianodon hypophthalmus TaxID=310915 RepID=A0A5N5N4D4_PANHP|nr:hypothetical protein PHYPO_G00015640 [Pangasianodon hypophthalmus]
MFHLWLRASSVLPDDGKILTIYSECETLALYYIKAVELDPSDELNISDSTHNQLLCPTEPSCTVPSSSTNQQEAILHKLQPDDALVCGHRAFRMIQATM